MAEFPGTTSPPASPTDSWPEEIDENFHYPMGSIPQGLCLLINIGRFKRHENRPGSNIDAASIKDVFENVLNFKVTMIMDPTLQELHQVLIKFYEIDHSAYDAFFIVILSHGDFGNVIYTSDSQSIKISEISDYFTSGMCPTLANKPKVFIVQACRGSKHNKTVSTQSTDSKSGSSLDFMSHGLSHDGGGLSGVQIDSSTPDRIDFFYAFATIDEHEALRHCFNGSWFINELVTGIRHFARKYKEVNLEELIKKVNQRLSKKKYEDRMQACEVTSSIRKDIILSVNLSFASRTHSETSSMISSPSSSEIMFNQKTLPKCVSSSPRNTMHTELVATSMSSTPNHFYTRSRERRSYSHGSNISLPVATLSARSELVASTSFIHLRHQYSEGSSYSMSRFSFSSSLASESEINLHFLSGSFSYKKPGYCIVINNNPSQYGHGKLETIREVFSDKLGFHVQIYSSLTRKGIKRLLKTVATIDHSDIYCLVIIMLGIEKSKKLEISDIVTPFKSDEDTPKVFFFETNLNDKGYASFYNELIPLDIPQSFIAIINDKVQMEETFLQYLLQTIKSSLVEINFQNMMKSSQKAFSVLQSERNIKFIDNLKDSLILKLLKSEARKRDQQQESGLNDSNQKQVELILAFRLLAVIREDTIRLLRFSSGTIMQVCKSLHISEGMPPSWKQAGTALALRTTLRLPVIPSARGKSLAVSVTDKLISMAKLEKVKAAIEVDRQLMEHVNVLMVECHLVAPNDVLILPPELFELISNCIKFYKISEAEAMQRLDEYVELLHEQYVKIMGKVQGIH
ncbi:PREDICTED: uncharacterized protein LOC109585969 [Amphimedon queenslandica]|uniref:Caspase family p20 domain-containing protein n=1 Tax=Amphimedon queenslandica TaxID=400682 RepID=A0A1X7TU88_AMPQE|nr:PREDICTED: uncharacterized protein LOC109585969 [Amphimedon queenslandica]|eukprot:XP_019857673.1 PREDICTED: uncharacterized protein LOC109585969 [Amphimedon queenslandica]